MSSVDLKLRRKFDSGVTAIANNQIQVQVTGTAGRSFLEIKIPIESVAHNTGSNSNFRGIAALPKTLDVTHNQFFITPAVIDTVPSNTIDNTDSVQIDISLVVPGKKPWEGAL